MRTLRLVGTVAAGLALAACGGRTPVTPAAEAPGPGLVVERFLQAANVNDLKTMTQLFGSPDKTIDQLYGRKQAEQRMYLLASLLRHDDFTIRGRRTVPGNTENATELLVQLKKGDRTVVVPHLVVRRKGGGWIIEKIDIVPITSGQTGSLQ